MTTPGDASPRPGARGRARDHDLPQRILAVSHRASGPSPWIAVVATLVAACADPAPGPVQPVVPEAAADAQAAAGAAGANSTGPGVCGRTPQVRDALAAATGRANCADVTAADLAAVFHLDLTGSYDPTTTPKIVELRSGDFQGLTNLTSLALRNNEIGSLPPGVFSGLSKLNTLDLAENRLAALPEGAFRGLDELWTISLTENLLTELPPDAFRGLGSLSALDLSFNRLRTLPPGVFDDQDSLRFLQLSANRLGALPDDVFDGTPALADLQLDGNQLAQWPAAVRNRATLRGLWMGGNLLRSVPSDALDGLDALERLDLSRNQLVSLPAGLFRGVSGLRLLWLEHNPGSPFVLEVKLERVGDPNPSAPGTARLRAVVVEGAPFALRTQLRVAGGSLSTPVVEIAAGAVSSEEFEATNAAGSSLAVTAVPPPLPGGDACQDSCSTGLESGAGEPLVLVNPPTARVSVSSLHLVQSAQSLDGRTPLVAGRQALLRVFATSDSANAFRPSVRATFFVNGRAAQAISLERPEVGIPTDAPQSRLARTFNATVPGSVLQPGVEMVVELDPERTLPLVPGSVRRVPAEGRSTLDVRRVPPLKMTMVPISFAWEPNAAMNEPVAEVAREFVAGRSDERLRFVRALLPVADIDLKVREPYFSEADTTELGAVTILEEVQLLRHLEAGGTDEHYHGLFARPRFVHREGFWHFLGVAFQPGYSGITLSHARDGGVHPELGQTLAHELGHNMSLGHAPCGGPDGVDEEFPYMEASVGQWGFEFAGPAWPARLVDPARHVDLMSYCRPYWISDYNFSKAMRFRTEQGSQGRSPGAVRSVLLRGGARNGRLRLEPALVWDARPKLPSRPGTYRLAGLDANGREVFSFSFEPDALNHGGGRSFLFAVPMRAEWETALQGFALRGPEGVATVDVEASRRLAVFTYPGGEGRAARIRGIAREWGGALPAGLGTAAAVDVRFGWPQRE